MISRLSPEDYIRSIKLARRKRGPYGPLWVLQRYWYQGVGWLCLALAGYRLFLGEVDGGLYAVAGLGVWCVLFLPLREWISKRDFAKNESLHVDKTYRVDDDGLSQIRGENETKATWKFFSGFAEDESVFVIFHRGRGTFVPISKAGMTAAESEQFNIRLGQHLPKR